MSSITQPNGSIVVNVAQAQVLAATPNLTQTAAVEKTLRQLTGQIKTDAVSTIVIN